MVGRPRDERGSESLLSAFIIPIIVLTVFACMQASVAAYEVNALAMSVDTAVLKADFSGALASGDLKSAVRDEIASAGPGLDEAGLAVDEARVEWNTRADAASARGNMASSISKDTTTATLTAKVSYDVPSIVDVPGLSGMRVCRDVSVEVPVSSTIEVRR